MKNYALSILFVICNFFYTCLPGKEKMGFATRDTLNLQMADKVVAFINDKDTDGLYNLFSEEVKENDSKLNSDIKLLIDYLGGKI